ncbi:MAG TPA: choice-of-anchor Q domain-containing protein [Polyangia bacterium]
MKRQTVGLRRACRVCVSVFALVGAALVGEPAHADYNIKATEAASSAIVSDSKCNLVEAVDSLNNGKTTAGSGLHGCVNVGGGKRIVLEGTGAHYNVGTGITIWVSGVEISSLVSGKDFVEGAADSRVIAVQSGASLTLKGLTIQRIGSYKAQVLHNQGSLTLNSCVVQKGDSTTDGGGIYNNGELRLSATTVRDNKAAFSGGGIYTKSAWGIVLSNSAVSNNTSGTSGAGIYGNASPVTLILSTVSDNRSSSHAGGIYNNSSTLSLDRSTIQSNTAARNGGGIYTYLGKLTMSGGCKVTGAHTAINGGGIYINGTVTKLYSTVVEGATASGEGGGIYNNGDLSFYEVTLQNNTATGNGGGLYSLSAIGIYLERSTISNNTSGGHGGGAYSSSRFLAKISTVSTNTAAGNGGGIYSTTGNNHYLELFWVTIGYNRAAAGGGVLVSGHANTSTRSSIVAKNTLPSGTNSDYVGNPHAQFEDTLVQYRCVFGTVDGNTNHPNDIIGNSRILPLADNGGPTKTHEIPADSTALNAAVGNTTCASSDQRGRTRPVGSACDIGSYERQ